MINEIGLFIKEKFMAFMVWVGGLFHSFWLYIKGLIRGISASTWRKVAVAIPAVFFLYILVGMPFVHRIDDRLALPAVVTDQTDGKRSQTVDMVIYLLDREVNQHNWTPNDPFFLPGAWIDNTPNYQRGILSALARFSLDMRDHIGRIRGSSAEDENLARAAGHLAKNPDEWIIGSGSWFPRTPAHSFYQEAIKELRIYNNRVVAGDANFVPRSDNLLEALDRISKDLGDSSASHNAYITAHAGGFLPDFGVDDEFYRVKGKLYAYTMLLKTIRHDFAGVIEDKELSAVYNELLLSLTSGIALDPLIVTNGAPDGILANHISIQGFYLQRARTQLKEITNILLK